MPLQLDFEICQKSDCSIIEFTETTGEYNAVTNPTGWGSVFNTVNPDIALYNYSKLEFFDFNNTLVKTVILSSDFPVIDINFNKEIQTDLSDGLYFIKYTVKTDMSANEEFTKTIQQAFYCNVNCCVQSMIKDIDINCNCSDKKIEKYSQAKILLQGLIRSAGCGNTSQFNNILKVLQKMCNNKCNCNC